MPGVTPTMRWIVGLSLFSISSTFFDVMPFSSASIMANSDHFTMSTNGRRRGAPPAPAAPSR